MAIAALVVGIVSCCGVLFTFGGFLGIVAVVLGIVALKQVNDEPGRYTPGSKGMAIAGIATGAVALLVSLLATIFFGALIFEAFECIEDPEAPGCEDFQDPAVAPSATPPLPAAGVVAAAWPLFARPTARPG